MEEQRCCNIARECATIAKLPADLGGTSGKSKDMLRIHGFFTEKQEESICNKIQKRLVSNLKPLEDK